MCLCSGCGGEVPGTASFLNRPFDPFGKLRGGRLRMIDARRPGAVLGDALLASHQVPSGKCAPDVWSKRSLTPWAKTGCGTGRRRR